MRIVFLSPDLPVGAAARHIELLGERHEVTVGLTADRPAGEARLGKARVVAAEDALQSEADVAIALHWKATVRLFEANAERYAFWVDSFAARRKDTAESDALVAALAYDLPVDFVAVSPGVAVELEQHRPDARIFTARNGANTVERSKGGDKLRVLVDDSTVPGAPAAAALKRMKRPHTRAKRLADADVLVYLDSDDGVLGAALDAARSGVIPVVLPASGQEDLVVDMESGIVGQPEDTLGVARSLDRMQADPQLRARLSAGAAARAGEWPDWDGASKEFERALKQISSKNSLSPQWPVRLMADAAAIGTLQALESKRTREQLNNLRVGRNPLRRTVRRIKRSRRLTPIRIAGSKLVPSRIKKLG